MLVAKIQVEVKYTFVLNFTSINREILSPYLRLAQLQVSNWDSVQESIILNFLEEGFSIDCRWDRLIFVCHSELENIKSSNGPLLHFFEILNKLKSQSSFGKVLNTMVAQWVIVEDTEVEDSSNMQEKFIDTFLQRDKIKFNGKVDDVALVLEHQDGLIGSRTEFGPFVPDKDLSLHGISPKSTSELEKLKSINGILVKSVVSQTSANPVFKDFTELFNYQQKAIAKVFGKSKNPDK